MDPLNAEIEPPDEAALHAPHPEVLPQARLDGRHEAADSGVEVLGSVGT